MFYDIFLDLCTQKGIKPGYAADKMNISRAAVTAWKKSGYTPRGEILDKIANYFNVTIDYLLSSDTPQNHLEQTSTFYDTYVSLCRDKGISPSKAAQENGINKSNVSNWKNNGYTPRGDVLDQLADYFGVTVDTLLGKPALSKKDKRDIAKKLEETLTEIEIYQDSLIFDGEPLDMITRELLISSIKNGLELSKRIAKEKYTPKKYKK